MNRRGFFKALGCLAGTAIVKPMDVLKTLSKKEEPWYFIPTLYPAAWWIQPPEVSFELLEHQKYMKDCMDTISACYRMQTIPRSLGILTYEDYYDYLRI